MEQHKTISVRNDSHWLIRQLSHLIIFVFVSLIAKLPVLPTHGTVLAHGLQRLEPLDEAVHVERVVAHAPHGRTVVARHAAVWTARLERIATDAAALLVDAPRPRRDAVPALDCHLHGALHPALCAAILSLVSDSPNTDIEVLFGH